MRSSTPLTKNFGTFIEDEYGDQLRRRGYHLFFNFTINSVDAVLEPNVPPLKDRLDQLGYLCYRFGSRAINWRFDPICNFITGQGPLNDNLHDFKKRLCALNMQLMLCCEKKVIGALPPDSRVIPSSCVPNDLLVELFGGKISVERDTGQRVKAGCGCKVSVDIGSYRLQPCHHNCLFCYANPASHVGGK